MGLLEAQTLHTEERLLHVMLLLLQVNIDTELLLKCTSLTSVHVPSKCCLKKRQLLFPQKT